MHKLLNISEKIRTAGSWIITDKAIEVVFAAEATVDNVRTVLESIAAHYGFGVEGALAFLWTKASASGVMSPEQRIYSCPGFYA